MLNFWLDLERYHNVDESHVCERWKQFREIKLKYFQLGDFLFPEDAVTSEEIIERKLSN